MMSRLADSKLGCLINCTCVNSIMYADDLIFIPISLMHLELFVDICKQEFDKIDMKLMVLNQDVLELVPDMPCRVNR